MDFDNQADRAWLLNVQRKLYQWSKGTPEGAYGDVWNWVTDPRNLRCAWHTIAQNKGRRTPGIDGLTVAKIAAGNGGVPLFLDGLREALRNGSYRPSPARRKWIPKPGRPGKFRPLGIPTVADRVLRGAFLAGLIRVPARTGLPWRTRTYPADHQASQVWGGWNAP